MSVSPCNSIPALLLALLALGMAACSPGDPPACGNGLIESGQVCFDSPGTSYAVGSGFALFQFEVGDFNGDGRLDMAVPSDFPQDIFLLLNQGGGSFTVGALGLAASGRRVVALDLDGDGDRDLVQCDGSGARLFRNDGTGNFSAGPAFPAIAIGTEDVQAARLNGDADADLIFSGNDSSGSYFLVAAGNDGSGNFSTATVASAGSLSGLAVGDFNRDGISDAAVLETGAANERLLVSLGNGLDGLGVPTFVALPIAAEGFTAIGDLDRDGDLDVVVVSRPAEQAVVLLGKGNGAFTVGTPFPVGADPRGVRLADFDGNGRLDLAIASLGTRQLEIRLGSGTGAFGPAVGFSSAPGGSVLAAADLNGDLAPDLVTDGGNNQVLVLLATP